MIYPIILVLSFLSILVPTSSIILERSIEEINSRYAKTNLGKLVVKVNYISGEGTVRSRFYNSVLKNSKIVNPAVIIEYSSSGETFSYNSRVIGYNRKGVLLQLDYSFYSNEEKIKVKKVKNISAYEQQLKALRSVDYDSLEKPMFPSDFVILMYNDSSSRSQFRLSEYPSVNVFNMLNLK